DAGRAEVSPRELFFSCPNDLDRLSGRLGQAGCFDCCLPGVLAAIPGTRIRDDDANARLRNLKGAGDLALNAERPLRPRPHRELVPLPIGDRGPRLQWSVRDVGDRVGRFELALAVALIAR